MKLAPGQRLGDYEIVDTLAEGGMSDSYRAFDTASGERVVIKVPFAHLLADVASRTRYEREIAIGQKLNHPGIQRMLATGRIDGTDAPFLVLEYVDGISFRHYLDQHKALPSEQAVSLLLQLARAIAYCHEQGIVHRDLKPENVLITPDGRLKLLDFGVALLQGSRRLTVGQLSAAIGTPDYMPPEQIQGERGDARTDVYALGMILFEMLAGKLPYYKADAVTVMKEHVLSEAPRLRLVKPGISPPLDAVVAKALRRDPNQRYDSLADMVSDLEHLDEVDVAAYSWDEGHKWPRPRLPMRGLPSAARGVVYALAALAALTVIAFLVQFAHHAPMK